MLHKIGLIFATFVLVGAGPAGSTSITKPLMNEMLKELSELKPYYVDEDMFIDPKNAEKIGSHLKKLTELSKIAKHATDLQSTNYKFSQHVLESSLTNTEKLFRFGNKSFARWQLGSTISVCMGCHTQMPNPASALISFKDEAPFKSKFDQAEFLFSTQSFEKSLVLFSQIIADFPLNNYEPREIETAFEKELLYYLRVRRNPKEAIDKFKAQLQNPKIPFYVRTNVLDWISSLELLVKEPAVDPAKMNDKEILKFASRYLEPKNSSGGNVSHVNYIFVSGILFEYLRLFKTSKATADILYYLSICDRNISSTFFYSLADLYLRECMIQYPHLPIAKKCFKEFEAETILGYSGSSGTHLPMDIKTELEQLKKLVNSGGKVKMSEH